MLGVSGRRCRKRRQQPRDSHGVCHSQATIPLRGRETFHTKAGSFRELSDHPIASYDKVRGRTFSVLESNVKKPQN